MELFQDRPPSLQLQDMVSRLPYSTQQLQHLTIKQIDQFPLLDAKYLSTNALTKYTLFRDFVDRIENFNLRLDQWRNHRCEIPSILTEYHVFSTLKTRLQSILMLPVEESVLKNLEECKQWFDEITSAKTRGSVLLDTLVAYKRQLKPISYEDEVYSMYNKKGRTRHGDFAPPEERLRNYRKKQSMYVVDDMEQTKRTFLSERGRERERDRQDEEMEMERERQRETERERERQREREREKLSLMMSTGGKQTILSTARDINNINNQDQDNILYDDMPGCKQFEQEQPSDGHQKQPTQFQTIRKLYAGNNKDHQVDSKFYNANVGGKARTFELSTKSLRVVKEEKEVAGSMGLWARLKSRRESQFNRALESKIQSRELNKLQSYNTQQLNSKSKSLQTIRSLQLTSSTLSNNTINLTKTLVSKKTETISHPPTQLTADLRNQKVRKIIEDNLKSIQHCNINDLKEKTESDGRYTSELSKRPSIRHPQTLTSVTKKRSSSLAELIQLHSPQQQNNLNQEMTLKVKQALNSKGMFYSSKLISNSFNVNPFKQIPKTNNIYRSGQSLLSNPWFPKSKAKKTKKKRL